MGVVFGKRQLLPNAAGKVMLNFFVARFKWRLDAAGRVTRLLLLKVLRLDGRLSHHPRGDIGGGAQALASKSVNHAVFGFGALVDFRRLASCGSQMPRLMGPALRVGGRGSVSPVGFGGFGGTAAVSRWDRRNSIVTKLQGGFFPVSPQLSTNPFRIKWGTTREFCFSRSVKSRFPRAGDSLAHRRPWF